MKFNEIEKNKLISVAGMDWYQDSFFREYPDMKQKEIILSRNGRIWFLEENKKIETDLELV